MVFKENTRHPNFILGAVSIVLLLVGVIIMDNGYRLGDYAVMLSIALGFIHWIWSIVDVAKNHQLNPKSRPFWTIIVLILPPVGGMVYYLMRSKNVKM